MNAVARVGAAVLAAVAALVAIFTYGETKWDNYKKGIQDAAFQEGYRSATVESDAKARQSYEAGLAAGKKAARNSAEIAQELDALQGKLRDAQNAEQSARSKVREIIRQSSVDLAEQQSRLAAEADALARRLRESEQISASLEELGQRQAQKWKAERDRLLSRVQAAETMAERAKSQSEELKKRGARATSTDRGKMLGKIAKLEGELLSLRKTNEEQQKAIGESGTGNCAKSDRVVSVGRGGFVDHCDSDTSFTVTRIYNAGPSPHVNLTLNGSRRRLVIGGRISLTNDCYLSLLRISVDQNRRNTPEFRFRCNQ